MGTRGPVPKRQDQRHGHSPNTTDKAPAGTGGEVRGPEPPAWLDGFACQWYESLRTSGQSAFYEDSDWTTAMFIARNMMACVRKPSAVMMASVLHGCSMLGATEGDRRRIRIELERGDGPAADPDYVAGQGVAAGWAGHLTAVPDGP